MPTPEDYTPNASTGPRTPEGKKRSSQNAIRHGLAGRVVVLPTEDMREYLRFARELIDSLRPQTPEEVALAQHIADGHWRLKRVRTTEDAMYALGHYEPEGDFDADHEDVHSAFTAAKAFRSHSQAFVNLSTYEQRIIRGINTHKTALTKLQVERKERRKTEMPQVLQLRDYSKMKNLPYDPAEDGFVYSPSEIEGEAHRRTRREEAERAERCQFNPTEFQKRAA